jgi:hypothetical protein
VVSEDTDQPWCLDVTVSDGDHDCWIYRRDRGLQVLWAPELQLLFKSKNFREKDDRDANEVISDLTEARRLRLRSLLPEGHPWHELLDR